MSEMLGDGSLDVPMHGKEKVRGTYITDQGNEQEDKDGRREEKTSTAVSMTKFFLQY